MGSIVLFSAAPKVGKTTFLQNLAAALARGDRTFLGFNVPTYDRTVLYLNLDETPQLFRWQVKQLGSPERLRIIDQPGGVIDVTQPAHIDALATDCRTHNAGVVIVDVWSSVFARDENSNTDVIAGMNGIQTLRELAGLDAVIVAHHSPKGASGEPRGASAFAGKADVLWSMTESGGVSRFAVKRGRSVQPIPSFAVVYDDETHRISRSPTKTETNAADRAAKDTANYASILTAIAAEPGLADGRLDELLGVKKGTAKRLCERMAADGSIRRKRDGRAWRNYPQEDAAVPSDADRQAAG
jgi:hypothetical protein